MCDSILNETRKARKQHTCIWCGEKVEKGQKYIRDVGTYDGVFQSNAWHPECSKACQDELLPCETFAPFEGPRPKVTE